MAGYYGYSMSNNAVMAYEDGEKPYSKWTKADIISRVRELVEDCDLKIHFTMDVFTKAPVKSLREMVLSESSWHHTSSWYNKTYFYDVDIDRLERITDDVIQSWKPEPEVKPIEERWYCVYLEWSRTRNHPKATEYRAEGVIKGNWFYPDGCGGKKKSVNANGFHKIRRV